MNSQKMPKSSGEELQRILEGLRALQLQIKTDHELLRQLNEKKKIKKPNPQEIEEEVFEC